MILYLHTELTGRYAYREPDDAAVQPHLALLGMLLWDERADEEALEYCRIVAPRPGWTYEPDAVAAHHIHPAIAAEQGQPLERVWKHFRQMQGEARQIVAFNWDHHRRVLLRTAADMGDEITLPKLGDEHALCAMRESRGLVGRPRQAPGGGFAWPKLQEAIEHFTGHRLARGSEPTENAVGIVRALRTIHEGILAAR